MTAGPRDHSVERMTEIQEDFESLEPLSPTEEFDGGRLMVVTDGGGEWLDRQRNMNSSVSRIGRPLHPLITRWLDGDPWTTLVRFKIGHVRREPRPHLMDSPKSCRMVNCCCK